MTPYAAHSALEPAGPYAARILSLFYGYFDVCALVFTLVIAALGFALGSSRKAEEAHEPTAIEAQRKRRTVTVATGLTVLTLAGLLIASVATGHAMATLPAENPIAVEVLGHKWWWEFRYPVSGQATRFSTAYELHIPVGRTVLLKLIATDVIHSFWVPSLSGKEDAIPGKDRVLLLRADRAGVYEGQCAEYCGTEHANMRFLVIAEAPAQFAAWENHQLSSPPPPTEPLRAHGLLVFMTSRCSNCHAISGTDAFATVGPDLTHFAARKRLAMGTLDNSAAELARWISDPQQVKPGVPMPSTPLAPPDLQALVAYLRGLE
ncbi:MAG TPA: cytochrome c oxidase subunit II [Polyangiaceae bacterium]|jgi:cytochrome c oxidase subunit 2|nr:cytochrome c oxidase subunit II [Polyangiaceae bacterium]